MDSQIDNNSSGKLKGLHQLSDDELLNALQNSPSEEPEKILSQASDIPSFISVFKIEYGSHRVIDRALFKLYNAWSKTKINKKTFMTRMDDHIPSETIGARRYYLINSSSFTITGKTYEIVFRHKIEKTKSKHSRTHFEKYLKLFDLKPGNYWIETDNLFYLYDIWASKTNKRNPLGKNVFLQFCYVYLRYRTDTRDKTWVQVDPSILQHISKEKIALLKRYRIEWDAKTNKKKSNKISKSLSRAKPKDSV